MESKVIQDALRSLGVGRNYLGHNLVTRAVRMVLLDERRLLSVRQEIFLPLAEQQQCDWRTIERNIRTVIHRAWMVNPGRLEELAGYPLHREPTVTEFVELLYSHTMRRISGTPKRTDICAETQANA